MRSVFSCLLVLLTTPLLSSGDISGNGIDELITVSIENDGSFSWSALEEYQESSSNLGTLGKIGDIPIPGKWNNPRKTSIGIIHQKRNGSLMWTVRDENGTMQSVSFGKTPTQIMTGADVDGSGFTDAIIVSTPNPASARNSVLQWQVLLDPFAPSSALKHLQFSFSRRDSTFFFFNLDGSRDLLGAVSPEDLNARLYDTLTETVATIPLPKIALKTDKIYPIRAPNGVDNLIIIRKLEYWIIDRTGNEIAQGKLRNQGTIVTGDYNSLLAGDEIGVRSGRTGAVPILNPELRGATTLFPTDGLLVDAIATDHFGPYRLSSAALYNNQCSRIEDTTTRRGREFKTITNSKGELLIQTRRLFSRLEVESVNGVAYPLKFLKSDGEQGGIWRGDGFSLSSVMPLGKVVGTINDERTCWNY